MSPTTLPEQTPVVVGVGQVVNRAESLDQAREPLDLLAEAVAAAADDSGAGKDLLREIDSVDVVNVVSWLYRDLPAMVADRLDVRPARTRHTEPSGSWATRAVDEAAARIAAGESRAAIVCGGEAFRSLERALKSGTPLDWTPPPPDAVPVNARDVVNPVAWAHGLRMPADVYPLYENALRSSLGQSVDEAQAWSARMWSAMSRRAAANPAAWNPVPREPDEILAVGPSNRMVSFPYPKLMNALLSVDQAAAVLLTDVGTARRHGIPEESWVYPWGGVGCDDPRDFLARVAYDRAPAMERTLDAVESIAGVPAVELDLLELYSCFPCVPKLAIRHLGLPHDRPISVTGGLTFFGGPGNAYMLHAVVAMVDAIRTGEGATGLLYGQGEFVTKHHALVVGREPRPGGRYPRPDGHELQAAVDALPKPAVAEAPEGLGKIEAWTVAYSRDGAPDAGRVVGRLEDGRRFAAITPPGDAGVLDAMVAPGADPVGWQCRVHGQADGLNVIDLA